MIENWFLFFFYASLFGAVFLFAGVVAWIIEPWINRQ